MNIRGICKIPGCTRLGALRGYQNGKPKYRTVCGSHTTRFRNRKGLRSVCVACGWKGSCDRHRIKAGKDGGRYVVSNLLVLCPNCHRAAHGKGEWNKPGTTIESLLQEKERCDMPLLTA